MTEVPSQIPARLPCKLAFLGEAPGKEELVEGRPLVGPSGRVFDAMLRGANIDRAECWVGNVFSEKLPNNDLREWCLSATEAKTADVFDERFVVPGVGVLKPEHRWHLTRLEWEFDDALPTVIVPLGATALWALTGSANIGGMRGAVTTATRAGMGTKLVPTFHPAFVMRQWKFYAVAIGDFVKAAAEAERGREVFYPRRSLLLEPTLAEVEASVDKCLAADLLSVDIETRFGQTTCIGFAWSQEEAICVPFVDMRQPDRNYWRSVEDEVAAWACVRRILESPVAKLGQNYGGYDAYRLLRGVGMRTLNMREDTRLLHHALYAELPKDLAFMGASYTQQGPWKLMGKAGEDKRDN